MIRPIWKDVILQVTSNVFEFSIEVDGGVIYRGRAYKRPNALWNEIKINKICENYLNNHIGDIMSIIKANPNGVDAVADNAYKVFTVKDKDGNIVETFEFIYDWSYDDIWGEALPQSVYLNHPINGRYAVGMYRINTILETVSIEGTGGIKTETRVRNIMTPSYPNIDNCKGKYAIYYLNSYGGWDSFLFEGEVIKEDNITQYTTDRVYDNTEPQFEIQRYVSEIQSSYVCNTGWLSDEQATNLAKNLISSNLCYLHNLESGDIIPAIIDEKSAKYQTYKTNGNLMAQYEIKIKESQTRIRR